MTRDDLPDDVRQLPLDTDAIRAEVVDLSLSPLDRAAESLFIGFCDDDLRMELPSVGSGVDWRWPRRLRRELFGVMAEAAVLHGFPSVLVALASYGDIPDALAREWRDAARREFAAVGVEVLGVYVANRTEVVAVRDPEPDAAEAAA